MITVPDATTLYFNLPKAEPLFMAAMASSYGPFVVNMKRVEENKTDDDPWAHEWFLTNADGTGPYKLVENNFTEGLSSSGTTGIGARCRRAASIRRGSRRA